MDSLSYLDFELQVERDGDLYRAEVLRSPAGEATSTFALPFSAEGIENLILKLGARRGRMRGVSSTELIAARELGGALFDAVFTGDVRACLRRSLDTAEAAQGTGLRLKLRLQSAGELADLPWEFLYDASQGRFLAQSNYTPLVRYVEMPQRIRPLAIDLPLRILVMISAPDDPDYAKLDVEHERRRVEEALAPLLQSGHVQIDWLERATLAHLRESLRSNTYHAFHFIGHGGFDQSSQEGLLILEDESNRGQRAGAHRIGPLLHDHRSLRLAVLNACEGARNSKDDPFSGIATSLIRHGIPAVVAMQFEISDSAAITFAHGFYAAIAEGYPVDMAVADARSAILVQPNDIEWATPVLYMRAPDGHLFDLSAAAAMAPGVLAHPVSEPVETLAEAVAAADAQPAAETPARELAPEPAPEETPEEAEVPPAAPSPAAALVAMQLRARGRSPFSQAGRFELSLASRDPSPVTLDLQTHLASAGYRCSLPRRITLNGGETRSVAFDVRPEHRRWRGRRFQVPFTIAAAGGGGEPPATVGGVFDDQPLNPLPFAGGSLLGIGALAVAGFVLFAGGDDNPPVPPASRTETAGQTPTAAVAAALTPEASTTPPPVGEALELIFFSSTAGGDSAIYSMNTDGSDWTRLTDAAADDFMPAATIDGSRVVFVSNRDGIDQIYSMKHDGSQQVRLDASSFVSLEPDAALVTGSVAFERRLTDTHYELYEVRPDGTVVAFDLEYGIDPAWSPDGFSLAFASNIGGNQDIYVMDTLSGSITQLTNHPGDDVEPSWSSSGSQLVFQSNRDGNQEIYMMNADGSEQQRLTFDVANDQDPVFSPDGQWVAFETDRDGNWEIYAMELASDVVVNLSNHAAEERKPSWSRIPAP